MKEVRCEYDSDVQYRTLGALVQCFEGDSINMDKFLLWVLKNYGSGSSIFLRALNNAPEKASSNSD